MATQTADRLAIEQLIVHYAKGRDTTEPQLYRQTFAPEAQIRLANGMVLSDGLDAILRVVETDKERFNPGYKQGQTSYGVMRHVVSNIDVTVSGATARADYYVQTLAYNVTLKKPEIVSVARQEDEFVRRGGRWWIERSTLIFGWENEEMGKALQVGPYTPEKYRKH